MEGVLGHAEAADLAADVGYLAFSDVRLGGLLRLVADRADVSLAAPSYVRVEARVEGHPWHRDTGTKGHMAWCEWSGSVLLTPPSEFGGGEFYFRDRPDAPLLHYRDMVLYDGAVENEHFVASNSGGRVALLMFFAGAS